MPNPSGRPKGIKEKGPRIKRQDVLNANREDWAKWSRSDGLLKKVRRRLTEIIEDKNTSAKDVVNAAKLILEHEVGRPTEAKEQIPTQPLNIFLSAPDGSYERLPERKQIEMEVREERSSAQS